MHEFWSVAVDAPLKETLTYQAPGELRDSLLVGSRVTLPLGRRKATGVLIEGQAQAPEFTTKQILSLEAEYPKIPAVYIKWIQWLSEYYCYPIGEVADLMFPPLKKASSRNTTRKSPIISEQDYAPPPVLTPEQTQVLSEITQSEGFSAHLVHGVTGSGKTEIYLNLLDHAIRNDKQGLVVVPEISLTPQLVSRFASRFGDQVAVMHSQLTPREKTNQWWSMVEGHKKILIGARSALFCPIPKLGIIVVDEEHEPSFKQEEKLKYHGRDAAVALAKFAGVKCVLGSATPSLETWHNANSGKFQLHQMKMRVLDRPLPQVEIIDMRQAKQSANPDLPSWLSSRLYEEMQACLDKQEQVALFLNRRGIAPMLICGECGHTIECPNCDISLTLHGRSDLVCHYCDYHTHLPEHCPSCKEGEIKPLGLGTELLETDVKKLFPDKIVARADRDEIHNREQLEELIENMESGKIDILIGTQMIAKGLDFPRLNLVGLVLADVGFNLPDFRATERSFQLITQVSGRSGRHTEGRVVVQTYNPAHASLDFASKHDYVGFANYELQERRGLNYPPYGRLAAFRISGTQLDRVITASRGLAERARQLCGLLEGGHAEVLGPAEAPLAKLRGKFRYHLLLKAESPGSLLKVARRIYRDDKWLPPGVRISVDIDPMHLL